MESANLHHQHQLQDQLLAASSALAAPTNCYGGVLGSNHAAWTPNIISNTCNFNPNFNGVVSNSRDSRQKNDIVGPLSSVIQDGGLHWAGNFGGSSHHLHLSKIKDEFSDSIFPKFPSNTVEDFHLTPTNYMKDERENLREKLLLKTFSSGCQINGRQNSAGDLFSSSFEDTVGVGSRGSFSQIFPSVNISNLNQPSPVIPNSLDMNMQSLDLLTSSRFSGSSFTQPSHSDLGLFKESLSFGFDHMQQTTTQRPSNIPSKMSHFTNGVAEAKRPSSFMGPNASQAATKKSKSDSRTSCPPFKVRKEKLGDRIAALQQLVAPFGKTDTASVLMEAIGYIKFLQNQVETLSVPYMKSARNSSSCRAGQGAGLLTEELEGKEEGRSDLRSRGLCVVPLSCMSYVTSDNCGQGVWPPHSFSGGT